MQKGTKGIISILLLIMFLLLVVSGCSSTRETDYSRMLGYMPSSLKNSELWYTDWAKVKKLNNAENITTLLEYMEYQENLIINQPQSTGDWSVYKNSPGPAWKDFRFQELTDTIGFDIMGIDRIVYYGVSPGYSICEADFDEAKITGLLAGLGYEKIEYGDYSYFDIQGIRRDDKNRMLLLSGGMGRIAVLENRIVVAPSDEIIIAILDAVSRKAPTTADNPGVHAVANSLDNVLSGVILSPDDLIDPNHPFNFSIPIEWGKLHQYDLAGMGYRNNGKQVYIDITLYYTDIGGARADVQEIVTRASSYLFFTQITSLHEPVPFTDLYVLEKPTVKTAGDGAILKLSCRLAEGRTVKAPLMAELGLPRDLLFLAPDPTLYVVP